MRVAILGSRCLYDSCLVPAAVRASGFDVSVVCSGGAKGVDAMAEAWAHRVGIQVAIYRPLWAVHGRSAGIIRTGRLLADSHALILIWTGCSRCSPGSAHTLSLAESMGLACRIHQYIVGCRCRPFVSPQLELITEPPTLIESSRPQAAYLASL